jgi:hypothetical protein
MTRATGKVLPTAILERHRSSDRDLHDRPHHPEMPVGLVRVVEQAALIAADVRVPSAVAAAAVLSARQASAARPAAARALAEAAAHVVEGDSAVAAHAEVEGSAAAEAVAEVAEDAGKMETTANCRSYRDTIWRERE